MSHIVLVYQVIILMDFVLVTVDRLSMPFSQAPHNVLVSKSYTQLENIDSRIDRVNGSVILANPLVMNVISATRSMCTTDMLWLAVCVYTG